MSRSARHEDVTPEIAEAATPPRLDRHEFEQRLHSGLEETGRVGEKHRCLFDSVNGIDPDGGAVHARAEADARVVALIDARSANRADHPFTVDPESDQCRPDRDSRDVVVGSIDRIDHPGRGVGSGRTTPRRGESFLFPQDIVVGEGACEIRPYLRLGRPVGLGDPGPVLLSSDRNILPKMVHRKARSATGNVDRHFQLDGVVAHDAYSIGVGANTRRTNVALLLLLLGALVTGALAYGIGTSLDRWIVAAHAVLAFAIIALAPWKQAIARRGLKRERSDRSVSLIFSGLVVVSLLAGILHSTGLVRSLLGITAMQVHVGAALISIPFAVWHVVARRVLPRRTDLTRRNLIRAGAVVGGSAAAYVAIERGVAPLGLPGVDRRFTGSFERGSFTPNEMPVTQWLDDSVPEISGSDWQLEVAVGDRNRRLDYDDLLRHEHTQRAVLDCTGGWYAVQDWTGVRLDRLIGDSDAYRSIVVVSATGYSRRFPLRDAPRLLLATGVGGAALSPGHGFPARIVAPGRRGFWWVKWVTRIEVDDRPWWLQSPFPLT